MADSNEQPLVQDPPKADTASQKKDTSFSGAFGDLIGGIKSAVGKIKDKENDLKTGPTTTIQTLVHKKGAVGPPYHHLDEYAWVKNILIWSNLDTVILILFALAIWFAYYLAFTRPTYLIKSPPSLQTQLTDFYTLNGVDRDEFGLFVYNTLRTLKTMDPSGKPFLPGIIGQVNPSIYNDALAEYDTKKNDLSRNKMVINLNITKITHVFINKEDKRISAYVRGFIVYTQAKAAATDSTGANVPDRVVIPYRARVLVESDLQSKVNRSGFYLYKIEEKLGSDAVAWDKEVDREAKEQEESK